MAEEISLPVAKERLRLASARFRSSAPTLLAAIGGGIITSLLTHRGLRLAAMRSIRYLLRLGARKRAV